jgi:hypothetical protein
VADTLSDKEILTLITLLKRLEPGKLPLPVFLEIARLNVIPIIEIVPLRKKDGKIQVLLTKRDDNDPNWPGMYHTPGTVVRASDVNSEYNEAFGRILEGELVGLRTSEPVFVYPLLHKVKRGMESSLVFWVEVKEDPKIGEFFDIDSLPENIIDTQVEFIKKAAEDYKNL